MVASAQDFKILVADDSRLYQKLVKETLAQEQYPVCIVSNGREAGDLLPDYRPALVITDWEMPDISGLELCRQIRSEHGPYTYIILLTGKSNKDQIIDGLAAGADDYLTKPFHPGELLARVAVGRRIVELHREIQEKNRQLQELALTDSLTGLPNRRAVEDFAVRQISGAGRHGFSLWVVMADLDFFKNVNDTHGHEAGDAVLKTFAAQLRSNTRTSDICGRIGGEEFVVVISHIEEPNTQLVVERIRQQLADTEFCFGGNRVQVTASFGVSGLQGGDPSTFAQLLKQADAALYSAKRAGRNRTAFAGGTT